MARKRLNKKVAIIGSTVLALLIFLCIAFVLYMSRNPKEFVRDGDLALKSAREATDEKIKMEEYSRAERNYLRASGLAKNDVFRVEMLFKLSDIYLETQQWRKVLGCWSGIINIEPDNIKARHGRLKYVYIVADGGGGPAVWQEVVSQASDFMKAIEEAGLFGETQSQWDSFESDEALPTGKTLGSYLFLVRGRAKLTLAGMRATTEPDALLAEAIEDLKKALEYEQDNIHVYQYLGQATLVKADILTSRGNIQARNKAFEEAQSYLQQAIDASMGDVRAYINLLRFKSSLAKSKGELTSLESDYLSLVEKFKSNPKVYFELSNFYEAFPKELDNAVEASDKALELDSVKVAYALRSCNLHYRKFSLYNEKSDLYRAIEIAREALEFPGSQETTGPRNIVNRRNRVSLYFVLATCYIEQLLEPIEQMSETEKEEWIQNAEDSVHQIEQIFGSGEDPQVVQWEGMLELAKGEKSSAIRKLYGAYEQLRASGIETATGSYLKNSYARLSYTLANYFKEGPERGAVYRFLNSALFSGIGVTKPQVLLDFVEEGLELDRLTYAFSNLDFYDRNYGASPRSKRLRIMAYIYGNQFEEAERELTDIDLEAIEKAGLQLLLLQSRIRQLQLTLNRKRIQEGTEALPVEPEDVEQAAELFVSSTAETAEVSGEGDDDVIMMELKKYREEFSDSIENYVQLSPESLDESLLILACRNYLALNQVQSARTFVETFLTHSPDSLPALFYKEYLMEPEPSNISLERRLEIQKKVLFNIPDSVEQWLNLGSFYTRQNEFEKAAEQFEKVLQVNAWEKEEGLFEKPSFEGFERTDTQIRIAASQLFGLAIERNNLVLAQKIANIARIENLDDCEGQYFYARLAIAQKQYEDALGYINSALSLRPVFSHGYMLRSTINGVLGNESASIEDAREAVGLNPQNPDHIKRLALVLCQRNLGLGDRVTIEQTAEARDVLDNALALNSSDKQLLSFYAEYISSTEPRRALAIRQYLYKSDLNVENALLLGTLAMKIALSERDEAQKKALLDISGQSLAEAYKLNPGDRSVLDTYAQYYRAIGEDDKAWELVEGSEDRGLLWRHYYRQGRYAEAKVVLEQLYAHDPTDANSLLGLLMVSKETGDIEGIKTYSEKLVSLEGNVEDYLIQIQTFLEVGLVKESELKLQSFIERFPDEARALLLQAWLMMRQGRLREALKVANRYLETNEDSAVAWEVRGKIHYLMTNYNQAVNDFNKSRILFDAPRLSIYLSKAYMGGGRDQEAITELQSAIDNPQISNAARFLLEEIYKKLNRKDALRRFYDDTIRAIPDNILWYIRAASFAQEERDFSRAARLYKRALQLSMESNQDNAVVLDGYLSTLISDGKYAEVFEEVPKHVNGKLASVALFRMAQAKLERGDRLSAIEHCRRALDGSNPVSIGSSKIVDNTYSLLGKDFLYEYCQERIAQDPGSEAVNLIMFYLMLKDNEQYNNAIKYIDKCIQISGLESPRSLAYILEKARVLNLAYQKTSDNVYLSKAVEEHKSLLLKMPNNTGVLNNLAYLLAESDENLTEALEYAGRAYEAQPNNPDILDTYAFVLYKNGEYEQAEELAQAALQHFEDSQATISAQMYEHLGMIQEKLGSGKEAIEAYKQALSIGGLPENSITRINSAINDISQQSPK